MDALFELENLRRLAKHSTFGSATPGFAEEVAVDRAGHQVCPGNVPGSRLWSRRVLKVAVLHIFKYFELVLLTIYWPVSRSFGHSSYEWEFVQGCWECHWKGSLVVR